MPERFIGYKRLTFKYSEGYKHLDRSEYLGTFKVLGGERLRWSDDGESRDRRLTVVAPRGVAPRDAVAAIEDAMSYGCQCEHDCCGHWQSRARARRTKGRDYAVEIHEYPNV